MCQDMSRPLPQGLNAFLFFVFFIYVYLSIYLSIPRIEKGENGRAAGASEAAGEKS